MSSTELPATFEEFWPYYVSQHQNANCRRMHFIGTTLAGVCLASTPWVGPAAIVAAPVVGYGCSWIGHFVFEKNKPASWGGAKAAWWSFRGDLKMWAKMATLKMDAEVEKYREVEAPTTNGHSTTTYATT
jgi:hypothetical protein